MDSKEQFLSEKAAKRAARNSRVHFVFDDDGFPRNPDEEAHPIVVQSIAEERYKIIGIYLGFLQQNHKYEVKFAIPMEELEGYVSSSGEDILKVKVEPMCCHILEKKWLQHPRRLEINMEVQISSSICFEDKFILKSDLSESHFINIKVMAQVLGKGMGTPSLKDGIRCVAVPPDDTASDVSTDEPLPTDDQ